MILALGATTCFLFQKKWLVGDKLSLSALLVELLMWHSCMSRELPSGSCKHKVYRCIKVPEERIEVDEVNLKSDLSFEHEPARIVDVKDRETRNRTVRTYKVIWSHDGDERDATWETEEYLKAYPIFYKKWY